MLVGETLDQKVQAYLSMLRDSGGIIRASIARAAATRIVQKKDSNLLAANGGHVALMKRWA